MPGAVPDSAGKAAEPNRARAPASSSSSSATLHAEELTQAHSGDRTRPRECPLGGADIAISVPRRESEPLLQRGPREASAVDSEGGWASAWWVWVHMSLRDRQMGRPRSPGVSEKLVIHKRVLAVRGLCIADQGPG